MDKAAAGKRRRTLRLESLEPRRLLAILQPSGSPTGTDPALALWLDANTGVTEADDGLVSAWEDQATVLLGPNDGFTFGTPTLVSPTEFTGGAKAIRFDGNGDQFDLAASTGLLNGAGPVTVIAQLIRRGGENLAFISEGNNAAYLFPDYVKFQSENNWEDSRIAQGDVSFDQDQPYTLVFTREGTLDCHWYIDGAEVPSTYRRPENGLSAFGSGTGAVGNRQGAPNYSFNGDIAEVIVYHEILDTADRGAIEEYLQQKYVASGPATDPVVATAAATDVDARSATLNGEVIDGGNRRPMVVVFWGTADGGTDELAWENSIDVGLLGEGPFSTELIGLTPETTYHYRAQATNSAATVWAPSGESFTTGVLGPPQVATLPATALSQTGATIGGDLLSTGGEDPDVKIFWGITDGDTDELAWEHSIDLGILGIAPFSETLTGLVSETTYYYRAQATNWAGTVWAPAGESFSTLAVGLPEVATLPATAIGETTARVGGSLLSTGGEDSAVRIFWGTADSGTTEGQWENTVHLGIHDVGDYSTLLTELDHDTQYFYRAQAGNSQGAVWAETTESFSTLSAGGINVALQPNGSPTGTDPPLVLWLDANTGVTEADDVVSAWADQATVGLGPNDGTTGGTPTLVSPTEFAGDAKAIRFDGNGDLFELAFSAGLLNGPGPVTVIAQLIRRGGDNLAFISEGDNTAYLYSDYVKFQSENNWEESRSAQGDVNFDQDQPYTIVFTREGTLDCHWYIDGAEVPSTYRRPENGLSAFGSGTGAIGNRQGAPNYFFNGDIAEVIVYHEVLSTGAREAIEVYLHQKYITPMPATEPAVATAAATYVDVRSAMLNGELIDDGNRPSTVVAFWGTADGGTDELAWEHSTDLGTLGEGPFSTELIGLTPETTYYYRTQATNMTGTVWAPSGESFTTGVLGPPQVTTSPAMAVSETSVRLGGSVLTTGGDDPIVKILWGTADGGTAEGQWEHAAHLGTRGNGEFATRLTGLVPETQYFFRAMATNPHGTAWAETTESFTTFPPGSVNVVINEFQALDTQVLNRNGTVDTNQEDWIELFNAGTAAADLSGWSLTDNPGNLDKWLFPSGITLEAGEYLVVYASGRDEVDGDGSIHTDFQLGVDEYLAMVKPDGQTIVSQFGSAEQDYPQQFQDVSFGLLQDEVTGAPLGQSGFFLTPTPGEANGVAIVNAGPTVSQVTHAPNIPAATDDLVVTARVDPGGDVVSSVTLHYRVMYGFEATAAMVDDGTGDDATADDQIYTATIPSWNLLAGEMVRYYVTAADAGGFDSREPAFLDADGVVQSPEYYGTVVADPSVTTAMSVLQWFTDDVGGVDDLGSTTRGVRDDDSGGRSSLFYEGELYDNVFVRTRGWSVRLFQGQVSPPKLAYVVEFNPQHEFLYDPDEARVEEIKVNSPIFDKSFIRHVLAAETLAAAGVPAPFAMPIRVQRNGTFFSVSVMSEELNNDFLDRVDLDNDGALYKHGLIGSSNSLSDTNNIRKKTRRDEDLSDLQALVNGLALSGAEEETFLFDNLDIPAVINYMAVRHGLLSSHDNTSKNYFTYRDTEGDGEWQMLPFDYDPAFGNPPNSNDPPTNPSKNPVMNAGNRMMEAIYANPRLREMYFRRIRTLIDEFFAPDTRQPFQDRIAELLEQIEPDSVLDIARWGTKDKDGIDVDMRVNALGILDDYIYPRYGYLATLPELPGDNFEATTILPAGAAATALVASFWNFADILGDTWTGAFEFEPFNDSEWISLNTGVGFDADDDYDPLFGYEADGAIETLIQEQMSPDDPDPTQSLYVRIPFTVDEADLTSLDSLTLEMNYDDGFAAYINGVKVADDNAPEFLSFESQATEQRPDANALIAAPFDLTPHLTNGTIVAGENILAIHGLNFTANSTDLLILPKLIGRRLVSEPEPEPVLEFAPPEQIEHNPASGNQDEEFIPIINRGTTSVDMSGWVLDGGVEFTFPPGTVILVGETLYVSPNPRAFRARATSPTGGEGHFVAGPYRGHISNAGEVINLTDGDGSLQATVTTIHSPSLAQQFLRISEIMYHPADPTPAEETAGFTNDDDFEYVELVNTSDTVALVLDGISITQGIPFAFADADPNVDETVLAPGGRILVVRNLAAFQERYDTTGMSIAGQYRDPLDGSNKLNNAGERVKLEDANNSTVLEFSYNDELWGGWPQAADGAGASLEVVDTEGDYDDPSSWRSGSEYLGSPGFAGTERLADVVINEVLSHPDGLLPDAIELHNTTNSAIDVGGWHLSDAWGWAYYSEDPPESPEYVRNDGNYRKFQIPLDTIIPPGGYVTFDEDDFNPSWNDPQPNPGPNDFDLDEDHGDQVWLMEADAEGNLIRFVDHVEFGAADTGEPFGRWHDGTGLLAPMSSYTPEQRNSRPRIGPLVISEVMYHPVGQGEDPRADNFEFVEIHNPTQSTVELTDWRIDGGIRFAFAEGDELAAGSNLVVVPFDPADTDTLAAFHGQYSIEGAVAIVGPSSGRLDNRGERIQLLQPGIPPLAAPDLIPGLLVDELTYDDIDPWPVQSDGQGQSLARTSAEALGNFATSWQATEPSPGEVDLYRHPGDANLDDKTDVRDFNIWNAHKFTSGTDWISGDFNGDGRTDVRDFNIWNAHKFTSAPGPAPVDAVLEEASVSDPTSSGVGLAELAWLHEFEQSSTLRRPSADNDPADAALDKLLASYWP